jgi:hypothetical protein
MLAMASSGHADVGEPSPAKLARDGLYLAIVGERWAERVG